MLQTNEQKIIPNMQKDRNIDLELAKTELADGIAQALYGNSAYQLPRICQGFGLAEGTGQEAFGGKKQYVVKRLEGWDAERLFDLAGRVVAQYPNFSLEELLERLRPSVPYRIGELTRRAIARVLNELSDLSGHLDIREFLDRIWPLREFQPAEYDVLKGCLNLGDSVHQHMVRNDDWNILDLLEMLNFYSISDRRFGRCLELALSPLVREEPAQKAYASRLNEHLRREGVELRHVEEQSGYPIYRLVPIQSGVAGRAKNLIFAADGPKPELVLDDAVNNDVRIVANAEYCLIYEEPIPTGGLLWKDLIAWWAKMNALRPEDKQTARGLYRRLFKSLASKPEQNLFRAYYGRFMHLAERLPALVPQVYLHYDPYTRSRLGGDVRLVRQRMDFLLLLSHYTRVVIEVDGKQHYAEGDVASPSKYAEMACADRQLKLAGYEVYRFGAAELLSPGAEDQVFSFFNQLFQKYYKV